MRLWHYKLVPYLPRQQLLSQWRECVYIAKNLKENGTPNHILVNKILNYPRQEFLDYCNIVLVEMVKRGYKVSQQSISKLEDYVDFEVDSDKQYAKPFKGWHNRRYLDQCVLNLEEKFDCGGISQEEWDRLFEEYLRIVESGY